MYHHHHYLCEMAAKLERTIRSHNGCDGKIEKAVPRIIVWHHEACRVITNDDRKGLIFLSYPHTNNGSFFLFIIKYRFFMFNKQI